MKCQPLIACLVLCCSLAHSQTSNQKLFDTIPFIPDHYKRKVEQFRKEPIITNKVIFLGNSITEGGNWKELTGNNEVINRGIGGDITFGVLARLDDITTRKPSKVFILIGINDIGKDIPDLVIAENVRKIITRIQSESPATIIFLQSILPLNPSVSQFPQHYDKEDHVVRANILLREVAIKTSCRFINLYPIFLDDQHRLDKRFTADGLHLNAAAYERWAQFLFETDAL